MEIRLTVLAYFVYPTKVAATWGGRSKTWIRISSLTCIYVCWTS